MTTATIIPRMGRKRRPPPKGTSLRMKFAQNLHRLARDVTYQEIADACGVRHQSVSAWFRGDDVPALDLWPNLAECLGVKVRDLLPRE